MHLVMAGKGRLGDQVKRLAKKLGLDDSITFPGFVKESEKPLYFKAADVFTLPSHDETFGIVNLEAMVSGTPIVATKVGGIPEVRRRERSEEIRDPVHVIHIRVGQYEAPDTT